MGKKTHKSSGASGRFRTRFSLGDVVVESGRGIGEIDVVALCEGFEDIFPYTLLAAAAFPGFTQVAYGQQNTAVFDACVDYRSQFGVIDQKTAACFLYAFFGRIRQVLGMRVGYFGHQLFCLLPVTFKRNQHSYFIPDILEAFAVIGKRL